MAGNIKGITIEFNGDTTKLDKSIREVEKSARGVDKELKNVDRALKFNPTSVDLWSQKQNLLKQRISDTESKLQALKAKQKDMDARGVDKNSAEYRKLQREIITTNSKLQHFKSELKAVGNVKLRAASAQLKELGGKATAAGRAMSGVSRTAAIVTGSIAALAYKSGKWADNLNTLSKRYRIGTKELQLYGAAANLVDTDVTAIAKTHVKLTRNMKSAVDGSKRQAQAFEDLGIKIQNADGSLRDTDTVWQETIQALSKMENETDRDATAMVLMGNAAKDLNPLIADGGETYKKVADILKEYHLDFVSQDTLNKANEFNDKIDTIKALVMVAVQGIGAQLAGVLEPALERVVGWAGKIAEWLSGVNPNILAVIMGVSALVAAIAPLLLLFGALATAAGTVAGVLAGISLPVVGIVAAIAALVAIFAVAYAKSEAFRNVVNTFIAEIIAIVKPVIEQVIAELKSLFAVLVEVATEVANELAPVLKALMPIILAIAKILVTVFVTNVKIAIAIMKAFARGVAAAARWISSAFRTITGAASSAASRIKSVFSGIKNAITHPFQTALAVIRSVVNKIRGAFSNIHFSMPHVPVPHFSISPAGWKFGDLAKGKIPSLSVKWYATGGIFDSPTIAGIGEAGPEAVIPLDKLWQKLDAIAASSGEDVTINVYATQGMDVKQLAQEIEQILIRRQRQRQAAWG